MGKSCSENRGDLPGTATSGENGNINHAMRAFNTDGSDSCWGEPVSRALSIAPRVEIRIKRRGISQQGLFGQLCSSVRRRLTGSGGPAGFEAWNESPRESLERTALCMDARRPEVVS